MKWNQIPSPHHQLAQKDAEENGAQGGNYPAGNHVGNSPAPANNGNAQNGSYQAGASAQNGSIGKQMYQQQAGNTAYGQMQPQWSFAGDGFSNIPEGMTSQLPFTA